jgi:hypothetical protein
LEKGISQGFFQSAVHRPCGNAFLAVETTRASSSMLAGPFAQEALIATTQRVIESDAMGAVGL